MWTCPKCQSKMDDALRTCKACGTSPGGREALSRALRQPSTAVFLAFLLLTVAVMAFGLVVFPYAPIRQVGDAFVDKLGQPHTAEDFRLFQRWERISTIAGIFTGFAALYGALERYLFTGSLRPLTDKGIEDRREPNDAGDAR